MKKSKLVFPLIILSLLSCVKHEEDETILSFRIIDEKIVEDENAWGWLAYAHGDLVFLQRAKKPSVTFNLVTGEIREIGNIGEAPGEYKVFPSSYLVSGETLYIGDYFKGKLILYDSSYDFIDEKGEYFLNGKTVRLDDSLIIGTCRPFEHVFVIYDMKNEREVLSFGEPIEYPGDIDPSKLDREGKLYPNHWSWDARESALMWYDGYNDQIRVYNLFTGELDTIFGKTHTGLGKPPLGHFPGDAYHPPVDYASKVFCEGLVISDSRIFIVLGKNWTLPDWSFAGCEEEDEKKIFQNNYFVVDVYTRNNYQYIGSFYPLNDYIICEDERFRLNQMYAMDDSTLNMYLQRHEDECKFIYLQVVVEGI